MMKFLKKTILFPTTANCRLLLLFPVFALLNACTTLEQQAEKSLYDKYIVEKKLEPLKKITSFRFHGWRSLDNEHLILSTSFSKPYLISLSNYCSDLRFAHTIAVENSGPSLFAKYDTISIPKSMGPKCRIESIYKITREQADELTSLKKANKTALVEESA